MSVTGPKRIEILNRDQGKPCAICRDTDGPFEVDHINPRSNGGGDEPDNLQKLCRRCNRDKNNYVADAETGELVRPAVHVAPVTDPLFRTTYTEQRYSVFCAEVGGKRASRLHDFAVLWDEDHDERVLEVVQALARAKLLNYVLLIGETKGSVLIYVKHTYELAALAAVERQGFDPCDGDHFDFTIDVIGNGGGPQRQAPGVSALSASELVDISTRWRLGTREKSWQGTQS